MDTRHMMYVAIAVLILAGLATGVYLAKREGPIPLDPVPDGQMPVAAAAPERVTNPLATVPEQGFEAEIIGQFAKQKLPDWQKTGKGGAPRVMLAKLVTGRDVGEVNGYIQACRPWSNLGSSWWAHKGDYDFTVTVLVTLLYLTGEHDDILFPETERHLLNVLINLEGGEPTITVPRSLGLVRDTENHILMMESSRYLKNQWLRRHGSDAERRDARYDNERNGLGEWLSAHLDHIQATGFYEFNSLPYLAYTFHPLLNLVSFAGDAEIRAKAQNLLDRANLQYALGSYRLRRFPPFRRQPRHAEDRGLRTDPHTAFMYMWVREPGSPPLETFESPGRGSQMLVAAVTGYRLPPGLLRWTLSKPEPHFARIGRGVKGSPEVYSAGPGYLLSAGGVSRGKRSLIVARPTMLMLDDGADVLDECFHIDTPGSYLDWNNTGVYKRFACGPGPLHVPPGYVPAAESGSWRIFSQQGEHPLAIATFSTERFTVMAVFPGAEDADALLARLEAANTSPRLLDEQFNWPDGGTLTYDLNAPKGTWVMASDSGETLDRNYDAWPKLSGELPAISFDR